MNILSKTIQIVAKSVDSDDEEGRNNELEDNSVRIKKNECAIKEE